MEINIPNELVAGAHESITSLSTAKGFTAATMVNALGIKCKAALVSVEDQNCRYRLEGTPDANVGHKILANEFIPHLITGPNLDSFKIIELGTGGKIQVTYYW